MNNLKFSAAALALALAVGAPVAGTSEFSAYAKDSGVHLKAGATVYDPSGGVVGTIESVKDNVAVVATGTHNVPLGTASFGAGAKGPTLAMTKAQLDAAAAKAEADAASAAAAQIQPGVVVYDKNNEKLGTVKQVEASVITLTISNGDVKLPRNAFGPGKKGISVGVTAAQLASALAAAKPAAATSTSTTTSTSTSATTATTKPAKSSKKSSGK